MISVVGFLENGIPTKDWVLIYYQNAIANCCVFLVVYHLRYGVVFILIYCCFLVLWCCCYAYVLSSFCRYRMVVMLIYCCRSCFMVLWLCCRHAAVRLCSFFIVVMMRRCLCSLILEIRIKSWRKSTGRDPTPFGFFLFKYYVNIVL